MSNTAFLLLALLFVAGWFGSFGISAAAVSIGQLCFVGFAMLFVLDLHARRRART